ncbi:putative aldouronate transport system permease protein [Paenibacillus algorifonticola]|uniref:Putative aldouronate transport system permease protein n=2 Tax=Paenibacillus algorifonticola TaxID=684063 RepID=A0A1I2GNX8_9BACL|nr:putative aldouronate transport system permease protein [Paenibacillus algorifonticola]
MATTASTATAKPAEQQTEVRRAQNPVLKRLKRYAPLFIMIIPGVIYLFINNYLPMLGLIIAFKDVNFAKGILASDWIGFKNFEYLFKTEDAWIITRNTLLYNISFIILNLIIAVGIAILLNEVKKKVAARFYQSIVLIPYLISMVIVGYLVLAMLSGETGFINKQILPLFGIDPISWYSEPKYWPVILVIVNVWKNVGYLCIIYLAAIIGIDPEYYEAATIDGAGKWRQITQITIPLIAPVITIMTLLQIGRIFYSDFGLFYQVPLNTGELLSTTNVVDTYVYRALINLGDIGMSSAAGLYQSVVGFVLVLLSNYIVSKRNRDNALF